MPDISLLQPTVLRGVVEKFTASQNLTLLSSVRQTPWPFPVAQWDVIRGSRSIAKPNVPNSEAHIVNQLGISQASAAFVYLREKKVFSPTTLHWLRTPGEIAKTNAEAAFMREITDLNQRFDNFAEWSLWQALSGTLTFDFGDVQAAVDYGFASTHKPAAGAVNWSTATPKQIIGDIRSWIKLVRRDGQVNPNVAYTKDLVVQAIFDSFATTGNSAASFYGGTLLSDRMKDTYYSTGTIPGFMGLDWRLTEDSYDPTESGYTANPVAPSGETYFQSAGNLVIANLTENNPLELMIGPSADDSAPDNYTGKFSKVWKDNDPSQRQFLLEWHLLPVITRPEQIVSITNVFGN